MGQEKISQNLVSGFRTTGIYPVDRQEILRKLAGGTDENQQQSESSLLIAETIKSVLEKSRYEKTPRQRTKKKRIAVVPGKSVSTVDYADSDPEEESDEDQEPMEDALEGEQEEYEEESSTACGERLAHRGAPAIASLPSEIQKRKKKKLAEAAVGIPVWNTNLIEPVKVADCSISDFLVVTYEDDYGGSHWYLGRVEALPRTPDGEEDEVSVSCMEPPGPKTQFFWPSKPDVICVLESNILGRLKAHPQPRGSTSRNFFISGAVMEMAEDLHVNAMAC